MIRLLFVFSDRLGPKSSKMIAECCSHESGHAVGLSHQSTYDGTCNLTATYNEGEPKDAEGYWYGDYYGVLAFGVNTDLIENVPQDWADLLKEEYANSVAFAGDPRTSSNAIMSVYAAGLANGAVLAADAGMKGLDFFKPIERRRQFRPGHAEPRKLAQGNTPIVMNWDYNHLSTRDSFAGTRPWKLSCRSRRCRRRLRAGDQRLRAASECRQAVDGASLLGRRAAHLAEGLLPPDSFNDLAANGKIPQELLDKLPPAAAYEAAVFPSVEEQTGAKTVIAEQWDTVVGVNVE